MNVLRHLPTCCNGRFIGKDTKRYGKVQVQQSHNLFDCEDPMLTSSLFYLLLAKQVSMFLER